MSTTLPVARTALSVPPTVPSTARIASIDLIRGAVMLLMAIDHVRVYSGLPAGGPTAGIFFTRWVTHFCAPAFVFLAGTSAWFHGQRHAGLSRFLLVRGLLLVFLELTLLRVAWTFNFGLARYEMAGVIWAIGWCMVLHAGLVKLPLAAIAAFGLAVVFGHNLMDPHMGELVQSLGDGARGALWKILYVGFFAGPIRFGADGPSLIVLYSIVPWIGVMATGFAFGKVLTLEPARRKRVCLGLGLGAIALFLVLRGFDLYGDPRPWNTGAPAQGATPPALFAFLNTTKYPASLDFLLMTLGPTVALIPLLERAHGALAGWIAVIGRVPFFFYVLHIPLIHALALLVSRIRLGEVSPWLFADHPMGNPPAPPEYVWSLGWLYAVWAVAIVVLASASRWFAGFKARRKDWWSSYL